MRRRTPARGPKGPLRIFDFLELFASIARSRSRSPNDIVSANSCTLTRVWSAGYGCDMTCVPRRASHRTCSCPRKTAIQVPRSRLAASPARSPSTSLLDAPHTLCSLSACPPLLSTISEAVILALSPAGLDERGPLPLAVKGRCVPCVLPSTVYDRILSEFTGLIYLFTPPVDHEVTRRNNKMDKLALSSHFFRLTYSKHGASSTSIHPHLNTEFDSGSLSDEKRSNLDGDSDDHSIRAKIPLYSEPS